MKKVLSLVLVVTLVLGSFGMVFAAAPSDVVGHKSETAVNVLVNMDIIDGYPDGTYKPEGIVTRAEMAKILVTALGLGNMVPSTTSSFTDMAGHWADGYVSYATSLGMIVGYPDGTFKPDATVSYEEAATMMVRALGYDDRALIGTWPGNYVSRALTLGLYKNVAVASGGANRGDIALMVYELLDESIGKVGEQDHIFVGNANDNMLIRYGATEVKTIVAGVSVGKLMDPTDALVKDALIDMSGYIGHKVDYYVNNDGDIIAVTKVHTDELTGKLYKTTTGAWKIDVSGKIYDVDQANFAGITLTDGIYINGDDVNNLTNTIAGPSAVETELDYYHDKTVTLIGKVSGSKITLDVLKSWVVDDTILVDNSILADIEDVLDGSSTKIDANDLVKDSNNKVNFNKLQIIGSATKLEDIKKDNIIEVYLNGDVPGKIARIRVSNKIVEGKVTARTATEVTIAGEKFKVSDQLSNSIAIGDPEFIPGATTKAWIAGSGNIVKAEAVKAASASDYALILDEEAGVSGTSVRMAIKVLTKDGEKKTIFINDNADFVDSLGNLTLSGVVDTTGTNSVLDTAQVNVGDIITYKTDSAGRIKEITKENTAAYAGITYASRTNKFDNREIVSNVVAFKFDGVDDGSIIKIADISDSTNAIYAIDSNGKVVAIAVDSSVAGSVKSTAQYAVVLSSYMVYSEADDTDVQQLDLLTADGKVTYMFKDGHSKLVSKGDLLEIKLEAGRLLSTTTQVTEAGPNPPAGYVNKTGHFATIAAELNDAITSPVITKVTDIEFTTGDGTFEFYDETTFYVATFKADGKFDAWVLGSASDLRVNAKAVGYDLDDDGEDYVDDLANANIVEKVFIVKSADAGKTVTL